MWDVMLGGGQQQQQQMILMDGMIQETKHQQGTLERAIMLNQTNRRHMLVPMFRSRLVHQLQPRNCGNTLEVKAAPAPLVAVPLRNEESLRTDFLHL